MVRDGCAGIPNLSQIMLWWCFEFQKQYFGVLQFLLYVNLLVLLTDDEFYIFYMLTNVQLHTISLFKKEWMHHVHSILKP